MVKIMNEIVWVRVIHISIVPSTAGSLQETSGPEIHFMHFLISSDKPNIIIAAAKQIMEHIYIKKLN
jgi:hypothetical protein